MSTKYRLYSKDDKVDYRLSTLYRPPHILIRFNNYSQSLVGSDRYTSIKGPQLVRLFNVSVECRQSIRF